MSKLVSRVEARLGVRLPQRRTRRQMLTEVGEAYEGSSTRSSARTSDPNGADTTASSRVGRDALRCRAPFGWRPWDEGARIAARVKHHQAANAPEPVKARTRPHGDQHKATVVLWGAIPILLSHRRSPSVRSRRHRIRPSSAALPTPRAAGAGAPPACPWSRARCSGQDPVRVGLPGVTRAPRRDGLPHQARREVAALSRVRYRWMPRARCQPISLSCRLLCPRVVFGGGPQPVIGPLLW
ncbi:LysR family transcriptional regulator [Azoarcus sp. CIB]|nr:LysR family transcriptional regulator [Azoarcus sp. CIB]